MENDLRVLRDRTRSAAADADADQAAHQELGSAADVGMIVSPLPSTASAFYQLQLVDVSGAEVEGTAATFTPRSGSTVYAVNLGTSIPSAGMYFVLHAVGARSAFRFDG